MAMFGPCTEGAHVSAGCARATLANTRRMAQAAQGTSEASGASRSVCGSNACMRSMLALTWERIDLPRRRLWVPAVQMKAGRTHGIPLSAEAIDVLQELRALSPEGEHVFQWKGRPIADCNTKAFVDALKRAKIKGANWHSLRTPLRHGPCKTV